MSGVVRGKVQKKVKQLITTESMGKNSNIQWTDATWNVARGCTKVDADCKFCYMYRDSLNETRYVPNDVVRTKTVFNLPYRLKERSRIFTSSLTDFFHPAIDSYRQEAWDIIKYCPHHTFQILTKRPERINECLPPDWDDNVTYAHVWLGTSVGSNDSRHRIQQLLDCNTNGVRFLSLEPLHGPVDLNYDILDLLKLDWVIIGGESGNDNGKYRYRPCKLEWIESIIREVGPTSAVFVKQLGTHLAKQLNLKDRHGGDWSEWPEHLRVRQFPILNNQYENTHN